MKSMAHSIARVVHEVNREYCISLGDYTQTSWEAAEQWQKDSALKGVEMHLANPQTSARDAHAAWMADKAKEGWKYGDVKNTVAKEHPCMVPYEELPQTQRSKDYIFRGVVHAIAREMAR